MAKFRAWFLDGRLSRSSALPTYAVEVSTNPFVAFSAIPADSRYRFLLDEAQYFIMNFIKGPVCRGQLARRRDRGPVLGFLRGARGRRERSERRGDGAAGDQPAAPGRMGERRAAAPPVARVRRPRDEVSRGEDPPSRADARRAGQDRPRARLGRRRPQSQRRAHGVPALRQRLGRARVWWASRRRRPGSSATRSSSASTTCSSPATTCTATPGTSSRAACTWTSCAWKASSTSWSSCRRRRACRPATTGTAVRRTR